jgi:hypothetical protein
MSLHLLALQLERERSAAKPIVEQLLATIGSVWDREIPSSWRTIGVVQELASAAAEVLEQKARTSLALAQFAIAVVSSISEDAYPITIRTLRKPQLGKKSATAIGI